MLKGFIWKNDLGYAPSTINLHIKIHESQTSNLNSNSESNVITLTGSDLSDFLRPNDILNICNNRRLNGQNNNDSGNGSKYYQK